MTNQEHMAGGRINRRDAVGRVTAGAGLAAIALSQGFAWSGAQDATPMVPGSSDAGYVVVRRWRLQPGASYDELIRRVEERFIPLIQDLPGFVAYYFVDPGDGEHMAVSVYADQAGADESTNRAAGWAEENVADLVELPAISVVGGPVRLFVTAADDIAATPAP